MSDTKQSLLVCGIMTGTSCDGIDFAAIDFNADGWAPRWEASQEYPKRLRQKVLELQKPGAKTSVAELYKLNRDLGLFYADVTEQLVRRLEADERPDVLALHGQTVGHFPAAQPGYTVQLGDPTWLARVTGITTVSHFREGDMTAGGQGAPLVPFFHYLLAEALDGAEVGVAVLNIGGIANFTYLGPKDTILASDTGPGNMLIDEAIREVTRGRQAYDDGGERAARGTVNTAFLKKALKHAYFKQPFPKSTGRDDFHAAFLKSARPKNLKGDDWIASVSALTVESIAQGVEKAIIKKKLPIRVLYVAGGGTQNNFLMDHLELRLSKWGISVLTLDDVGFSSQHIEAQAFAFLGYRSLLGLPVGGKWTGAQSFGPPGWITPGRNWSQILSKLPVEREKMPSLGTAGVARRIDLN